MFFTCLIDCSIIYVILYVKTLVCTTAVHSLWKSDESYEKPHRKKSLTFLAEYKNFKLIFRAFHRHVDSEVPILRVQQ